MFSYVDFLGGKLENCPLLSGQRTFLISLIFKSDMSSVFADYGEFKDDIDAFIDGLIATLAQETPE